MTQTIHCRACDTDTRAADIAELIDEFTDDVGRFLCEQCGATNTFVKRPKAAAKNAEGRWIRGALPIKTKTANAGHSPFVFLTADDPDGEVTGIEFKYYRTRNGKKPTGGPVFTQTQLLALVGQLAKVGVVSPKDWRRFLKDLNGPPKTRG